MQVVGLPAELENVVKSMWALRLQLLSDKVETHKDDNEMEFSSQPTSEDDSETEEGNRGKWTGKTMPTLMESLALCYLAAMILRLPLSIGDLHQCAVREDVPLIRAVRLVPASLKRRLPAEYLNALDTVSPLQSDHLRIAVHRLYQVYEHQFQLQIPSLNTPLLLHRYIRRLAIPVPVHWAVGKVAGILSMNLSFPATRRRRRQKISDLPELALISLLVIAVKLYYPFNATDLSVDSTSHPALSNMDWDAWLNSHTNHRSRLQDRDHLMRGSEMNVKDKDAMEMTETQMDDYLDWCERTWVDEDRARQKPKGLSSELLDMFPTGRQDGSQPKPYDFRDEAKKESRSTAELLTETMHQLTVRRTLSDEQYEHGAEGVKMVGSTYQRYRCSDDLTRQARAFHEAVADMLAVKLETVLIAVLQTERRLVVWREEQVKARREMGAASQEQDAYEGTASWSDPSDKGTG